MTSRWLRDGGLRARPRHALEIALRPTLGCPAFNVGHSDESYTKTQLVERLGVATSTATSPRDYA